MVAEQLQNVRAEIRKACEKSGRNPEEVTLIAVSKTKPISMIREAMDAGQTIFGENKVQELCTKYEELPKNLEWHLIGHLQRNKVKYIADKAALIHYVDSCHYFNWSSHFRIDSRILLQPLYPEKNRTRGTERSPRNKNRGRRMLRTA